EGIGVIERVAVNAARRARGTELMAYAVNAGRVFFGLQFVASGAIDRFGRDIVIRMLGGQIRMTTGAAIGLMDGRTEFGFVYEQPNCLVSSVGFEERFIGVTVEAGAVLDWLGKDAQSRRQRDSGRR